MFQRNSSNIYNSEVNLDQLLHYKGSSLISSTGYPVKLSGFTNYRKWLASFEKRVQETSAHLYKYYEARDVNVLENNKTTSGYTMDYMKEKFDDILIDMIYASVIGEAMEIVSIIVSSQDEIDPFSILDELDAKYNKHNVASELSYYSELDEIRNKDLNTKVRVLLNFSEHLFNIDSKKLQKILKADISAEERAWVTTNIQKKVRKFAGYYLINTYPELKNKFLEVYGENDAVDFWEIVDFCQRHGQDSNPQLLTPERALSPAKSPSPKRKSYKKRSCPVCARNHHVSQCQLLYEKMPQAAVFKKSSSPGKP